MKENDVAPDLRWNRGSSYWSCTTRHSKHGTFSATYGDSGILTVITNGVMVRHQRSDHLGACQALVRRYFVEFWRTGTLKRRISRVKRIGNI